MSNVARLIIEDDRPGESSVTTADKRPGSTSPPGLLYDRFWEHYKASPERKWELEVLQHLFRFAQMKPGWDSYGAPPLKWDAGLFAMWVLSSVMRPRTPVPQVVPSSVGGVQLEWHEKDIDLELHIAAPFECELWFLDHRGGAPVSQPFSNDFSALAGPISELTSR